MSLVEKYEEDYKIGFPIFEKLFQLRKEELITVLKNIFQDNKSILEILENKPRVIKTLVDDVPEEIGVYFFSSIVIDWSGIKYTSEHGSCQKVLKFNEFFNIDVALKS